LLHLAIILAINLLSRTPFQNATDDSRSIEEATAALMKGCNLWPNRDPLGNDREM